MTPLDLYRWARGIPRLTATQNSVLREIATYGNRAGECWPSQATVAANTCLSERAVRGALADLEKLGLIERRRRSSNTGRQSDVIVLRTDRKEPLAMPEIPAKSEPSNRQEIPVAQPADERRRNRQQVPGKRTVEELHTPPVSPPAPIALAPILVDEIDAWFDVVWKLWPRKQNRLQAGREFRKQLEALPPQARAGVVDRITAHARAWSEPKYTPALVTWLRDQRWEDDLEPRALTRGERTIATVASYQREHQAALGIGFMKGITQ